MSLKIKLTAILTIVLVNIISATNYYVSKTGNDGNSGLDDWVNAWETLDKVNDGTFQGGDTVYFGTGIWRGHLKLQQGTFGNHVVYACSARANTNGNGDYHFAKIYGSVNYKDSSWTNVAGNVYKTHYAGTDIFGDTAAGLCAQGDSLLWWVAYGDLDAAGEFSYQGDSLYVYLHDLGSGYDPSNYDMETSMQPIIIIWGYGSSGNPRPDLDWISDSASYVSLYGLEFKYGCRHIIGMYQNPKPDSFFVEHCKLSYAASWAKSEAENPALIYANNSGTDFAEHLYVTACSLGYVVNYATSNHGTGITFYSAERVIFDSCTFYGYFTASCWMAKCAYGYMSEGNVIKNCIFNPTSSTSGIFPYLYTQYDTIYGNIFKGTFGKGALQIGCTNTDNPGNNIYFWNNTIYDAKGMGKYEGESACSTCYAGRIPMENVEFKYNVLYASQTAIGTGESRRVHMINQEWFDSTGFFTFDSNLYCVDEQVFIVGCYPEHYQEDSTHWADTLSYDLNSNWVNNLADIGFNDPANGDFSRPDVAQEMYNIIGADTFSIYGAWQPNDPLPPPRDSIPPGIIEDLNAIPGNNHGEIILTWTAPGDDGFTGLADHYVIKYSPTAITESNWADFLAVLNPPQPLSSGDSTYFALDTHEDGYYYYIAIKTYDEVGNVSDLSNVAFTFSAGIMMPIQIETYIDSLSSLVTVSCELVESYQSIYYLFALDSLSVYSNPEFVIDSLSNLPSDVAMAVFEGLSDDVNYYWRCCAISTDYTDSSAWTPSIEFNLNFGLISSFAESDCLRPTEGEIIPSSRPYFIVRNPQNIYELYFQVDDNDNFSSPVESGSVPPTPGDETRWQLPATDPIEQGITYYWRVSNNNAVWTSPISFSAFLEIHPYPNPFRASEGHTNITFTNLPQDSSIMISTISGDIILREDNIGPGDWVWDVKNDGGNNLAPGVYLYAINLPSGSSNGKLLIIR